MARKKVIDSYNLRSVILNYTDLLSWSQKAAEKIDLTGAEKENFTNLIICGMGGSALSGDLLFDYLSHNGERNLPIYVCRSYNLPEDTTKNSLIFISSYSGNTEETISCFREAIRLKCPLVVFSQGGAIASMAKKRKIPLVTLNIDFDHFEPRYAALPFFASMHEVLHRFGLTKKIKKYPKIRALEFEKEGKRLAGIIAGKTPLIYASEKYEFIARNWKIKINENAKTPAFYNFFPELNHNEMVGFTCPKGKFIVLILTESSDHPRVKKRMLITSKLYNKRGIKTVMVTIKGQTFLEKIIKMLVLGDWVSYYLALLYQQDPSPVKMVEEFKVLLTK